MIGRAFFGAAATGCLIATLSAQAGATGTVRVQQHDGSVQTYPNVHISIGNDAMSLTTADGKGTLIIGKASCTKIGELIRCLPYDATLQQHGESRRVALQAGTAWFNPTTSSQPLALSSTQLPAHGVLMSVHTKAGTYVSLTGVVDEIKK